MFDDKQKQAAIASADRQQLGAIQPFCSGNSWGLANMIRRHVPPRTPEQEEAMLAALERQPGYWLGRARARVDEASRFGDVEHEPLPRQAMKRHHLAMASEYEKRALGAMSSLQ